MGSIRTHKFDFGREKQIIEQRAITMMQTLELRRILNLGKPVKEILLAYEKCIS